MKKRKWRTPLEIKAKNELAHHVIYDAIMLGRTKLADLVNKRFERITTVQLEKINKRLKRREIK